MITITSQAAAKLVEILKQQEDPDLRLRLFTTKGGCHGFTYGMAFDRERRADDEVVAQNGIEVLVDPVTSRVMAGAQIDYIRSVSGEGFTVRNPNAVETCGCGHSFRTRDDDGEPDPCEDATTN
ncbi:MAG: iron-sulfur cluster insertion protein ErpA [Armatimonadetes bacterium]|nr:iron-sulfur cluster insertion protein ErpA [Armatimonadota bacterium]